MKSKSARTVVDQLLAFHRISGHKFELSGLRTGSIRDQMLRAHLVTCALIERGFVSSSRPLLIVGSGACGVTCAMTAASKGVSATVLEHKAGPFRTQMYATSRRLDPSEFDWPHPHWSSKSPPWPAGALPLHYFPESAALLALVWEEAFFNWLETQSNPRTRIAGAGDIDYVWGVDARQLQFRDDEIEGIDITHPLTGLSADFGAVISCVGFSGERVAVTSSGGAQFSGYEFWGPDPVEQKNFGTTLHSLNVLISGGGDGAQQDFLRTLTGDFGLQLYARLAPHLPAKLDLLDVVLAEDAARRAYVWRRVDQPLPRVCAEWNQAYCQLVDQVFTGWTPATRRVIASELLRPGIHATWLLGGDTPDFSYGLNRLLALLIARLHAETNSRICESVSSGVGTVGDEVMVRGFMLDSVNPDNAHPHVCGDPLTCFALPHHAVIRSVKNGITQQLGPFHIVIVRHGVVQRPLFARSPVYEQLTPIGLPN